MNARLLSLSLMVGGCEGAFSPAPAPHQSSPKADQTASGEVPDGGVSNSCIEGVCAAIDMAPVPPADLAPAACQPLDVWNDPTFTAPVVQAEEHDPVALGRTEDCLTCHGGSPPAGVRPDLFRLDFGGRVHDRVSGLGVSGVEIRVPTPFGGVRVKTNSQGYFYWPPQPPGGWYSGGFTTNRPMFPSAVGLTDGAGQKRGMCTKALNGNCGSCHNSASSGSTAPYLF
jgi:hypothetical protein